LPPQTTASGIFKVASSIQPAQQRRILFAWFLPCIFAFGLYLPSLSLGFILDDHPQIVSNPQIQSWDYLPRLLTSDVWSQREASHHVGYYYRPLFSVWMLIVHSIGCLSPWLWHLSSLFLHALATYVVFMIIYKVLSSPGAAFGGALLFSLHPIHVDAVSWVSASNEVLFTIFAVVSLLYGLACAQSPGSPLRARVISILSFAAACFTKETALALAPLFFLLHCGFRHAGGTPQQRVRLAVKFCLPYLYIIIGYLCLRWLALGAEGGINSGKQPWEQVLYSSPSIIVFYLRKLVWPFGLSAFYVNPLSAAPDVKECLIVL
jgi:hypothetical protein